MKIRSVLPTTKLHGIEIPGWPLGSVDQKAVLYLRRAFVWPDPRKKPNYPLKVREIVAKQGNICFFEIAFWQ